MQKIKLFCFPYAGGSALTYLRWKKFLNRDIELCPIELAGRGKRLQENFYNELGDAVNDIYSIIKNDIDSGPYALFGHSMGSVLAYELYYKIENLGHKKPLHIFFSGRGAPNIIRDDEEDIHMLPEDEFLKKIDELNGTPKEVFEHKELLELVIPILRSDFKLVETYKYIKKENKIQSDISVMYGENDDMELEEILAWKEHAEMNCKIHKFRGDHFYINDFTNEVVSLINTTLMKYI